MIGEGKSYREGYINALEDVHDMLIPIVQTYKEDYLDKTTVDFVYTLKSILRAELSRIKEAYIKDYDTGFEGRTKLEDFNTFKEAIYEEVNCSCSDVSTVDE